MDSKYILGIDFGTDSVRTVLIDSVNGNEVLSSVSYYPRWSKGLYCNPENNQFRQHPLDYIESLEESVKEITESLPEEIINSIAGIGIDTTGSTLAPVDKKGNVLALLEEFKKNPNAMFVLWKDHTAVEEAELINKLVSCHACKVVI
ncbi:Ribulokinase [subsurface metagenome]|nr:hypothetical protein [Clostridia bacterium]